MVHRIELTGEINSGLGWASKNWRSEMIAAHGTSLDGYVEGTLNVDISQHNWSPPNDTKYWEAANVDGIQKGIGILQNGNYIHPDIKVISVNGVLVDGRLYFPAGHVAKPTTRNRLEIISKIRIRDRLKLGANEDLKVTVVLEIADATP